MARMITTKQLVKLNEQSIKEKYPYVLSKDTIDQLDPDRIHVLCPVWETNDMEIRAMVFLQFQEGPPKISYVCMDAKSWYGLPRVSEI